MRTLTFLTLAWAHAGRLHVRAAAGLAAICVLSMAYASARSVPVSREEPPATLAETGLPIAGQPSRLQAQIVQFAPQYPLWSDGAHKQRWLYLPRGTAIDASNPDAWEFPIGTRLWKEFGYAGKPVETRYITKLRDGTWQFASYIWNAAGTAATLAPERGGSIRAATAPGGKYAIPSRTDCFACHGSARAPVLGLSALQLSSDRDPMAVGAVAPRPEELDLPALIARGLVRGLPKHIQKNAPRIAASTPLERAALGYMHGNCAHCHNGSKNAVPLALTLEQRVGDPVQSRDAALRSTVDQTGRFGQSESMTASVFIKPGQPDHSLLVQRMRSRRPADQMPPLGTELHDPQALELISRWIAGITH